MKRKITQLSIIKLSITKLSITKPSIIKLSIALVAVVILGLLVRAAYLNAYRQLRTLQTHANAAEFHLRAAQSELKGAADSKDIGRIGSARTEFAAARQEFAQMTRQVESFGPLYGILEALPSIGPQAKAARKLMYAGGYVSQAGEEAGLAVESLLKSGGGGDDKKFTELLIATIPTATAHFSGTLTAVDKAYEEYADIPREGLHPLLLKAVGELDAQLPKMRVMLKGGMEALRVLPETLGQDGERVYLVLVQDSTELRPTGGFVGNYGIIRIRNGKIVEVSFNDSYRVDWPYYYSGRASPPIGMFARYFPESTFWALRDANIWPDFERSAKQAAWFAVEEGAAERVDGVIGITQDIVNPLMKAFGPIYIPEYGENVDQFNVLDRIRFHQTTWPSDEVLKRLGDRAEGNRKLFTSLVLKAIVERLTNLDLNGTMALAPLLQDSFNSKAVQVYFARSELQKIVEAQDIAGQMKSGTGDYLWVVDMNLSAAKDNLYVKPSINYKVKFTNLQEAISELELTYDYRQQGPLFTGTIERGYYANYLRVFVPPGSTLIGEDGTDEPVETSHEQGKTVFGNFVKVYPGTVKKLRLRYRQPLKLWTSRGRTTYELLVQKQAGNNLNSFEVAVTLPDGTSVDNPGNFKPFGNTLKYQDWLPSDTHLTATFVTK